VDLLLFEKDPARARLASEAGVAGFVLDWEQRGKAARQVGEGLEENADTPADVQAVRAATTQRVLCRVNPVWEGTPGELDLAIDAGADLILLPMVRSPREVGEALSIVKDRARVGILVETATAVDRARDLALYPLDLVYVGLNDLRLERKTRLFAPLGDGTLDRVRDAFHAVPFGFGGLTVVDGGAPLPCRLLLSEMARLRCDYAFLRRSWKRDVAGRDMGLEVARLETAYSVARARSEAEVAADRGELLRFLEHAP
jgi:hypothetical protein